MIGMQRRAAIYSRISSDPDGTELAVERQVNDCQALADKLGWQVVTVYRDNDVSAYSGKPRPGYLALIEQIRAGSINAVVIWHPDRLHRSTAELEPFIELCEKTDVAVQSCQSGLIDLSSPGGKMTARIVGAVARHEVDQARARMKRAHEAHAQAGKWRLGQRPFGWEMGGESLREDEADAIRSGVETILRGGTLRTVVRDWKARGLVSAQGKDFTHTAVKRILASPRIAGISIHHGKVVGRGTWPSIIDEDSHRALLTILKDPSRRTGASGGPRKYQGTGIYLCGVEGCGAVVQSYTASGNNKAYKCSRLNHLVRRQADLDEFVDEYVFARLSGPDARLILQQRPSKIDVNKLTLQREKEQALKNELIDMRMNGLIDVEQLRRGSKTAQDRIDVIDRELARARIDDPLAELLLSGEELRDAWPSIAPEVRGQIISRLCTVTILPSAKGQRGFRPEYVRIDARND
ncbi:hypothetical protein CH282_15245 [Rhodococcus sp. 06-418-1B]|nr:recombinase family protein [Rhodococcus sp. 06-418-1B]OZC84490.1 hypothetical protein CH282_15245 [Rhodococcus sp. 06-418-1B]